MSCFIDFIDINLWEKYTLTNLVSLLNARIICSAACFCSVVKFTQLSNNSLSSGDNSTISLSQKNCESVIPNPLQIASKVEMEGIFLYSTENSFSKMAPVAVLQ